MKDISLRENKSLISYLPSTSNIQSIPFFTTTHYNRTTPDKRQRLGFLDHLISISNKPLGCARVIVEH